MKKNSFEISSDYFCFTRKILLYYINTILGLFAIADILAKVDSKFIESMIDLKEHI